MKFDPTQAKKRLDKFWSLHAGFGHEHNAQKIYLQEIVSDRYVLVNGLQLIHDELQLAATRENETDVVACGVDLSLPSVLTTLAHTNCGDRIHQGQSTASYEQMVASRFASKSELGDNKLEAFFPTGGGTDDGHTLAHVTVAHAIDEQLREHLYAGNASSYMLVNFDLKTHVGCLELPDNQFVVGKTMESKWRMPRSACGAIVGTLATEKPQNAVQARIYSDLGPENFELLSKKGVKTVEGVDIRAAVGAAIVAIQGMINTAKALETELDERGMGHLTASITVNRPHLEDTIIYLARATVFDGEVRVQGFGTDASKYGGRLIAHGDERRLVLTYEGLDASAYAVRSSQYTPRQGRLLVEAND